MCSSDMVTLVTPASVGLIASGMKWSYRCWQVSGCSTMTGKRFLQWPVCEKNWDGTSIQICKHIYANSYMYAQKHVHTHMLPLGPLVHRHSYTFQHVWCNVKEQSPHCITHVGWSWLQTNDLPLMCWIMPLMPNTSLLAHFTALLAAILGHSSLVRHWHTHIIDFHLDNLMFTDNSQPLHHGRPSPSLDIRARLSVICHHISSSHAFFLSLFFFFFWGTHFS